MSRNWIFYLEDILECAQKVRRYADGLTFEQFQAQDMVFDAIVRNLEIIGEAAKHLPPEGTAMLPNVDWGKVAGFRDVIVHGYFGLMLTSSGMSCSRRSRTSFHLLRKPCRR